MIPELGKAQLVYKKTVLRMRWKNLLLDDGKVFLGTYRAANIEEPLLAAELYRIPEPFDALNDEFTPVCFLIA